MGNNALIPVVAMVEAVDRPKLRDLQTNEVYNPLVLLIAHLYLLRGQTPVQEDLRFQAAELEQELRNSYSWLSLEEVRIALDNGVKKKYGDYFGLNVITYLDWIKAYSESEARRKAQEEARIRKLPPPHVPTPEEIEALKKRNLLAYYDIWAADSSFKWCPDPTEDYQYLLDLGLLNPTTEEKNEAIEFARKMVLERELQSEKENKVRRGGNPDIISNIINKYKEGDITNLVKSRPIILYAKAKIIFDYFAKIKDENISLKSLINPS